MEAPTTRRGDAVALKATSLTYDPIYRIKGVPEHDEGQDWHYIGHLDGVARFSDGHGKAVFLRLDRLAEIEPGRLAYTPPG
jgi:hypothetical protein